MMINKKGLNYKIKGKIKCKIINYLLIIIINSKKIINI